MGFYDLCRQKYGEDNRIVCSDTNGIVSIYQKKAQLLAGKITTILSLLTFCQQQVKASFYFKIFYSLDRWY